MLETKDLILKKADFADWKSIYRNLWSHDESAKYMIWRPIHTEEEAQERMHKNIAFMERNELAWFVYEKGSNEVIGFAGMEKIDDDVYEDTGIAIGPKFTRKGYGKQILKALYEEAFNNLGALKFVTSCRNENKASINLQLSLNFKYTHSIEKLDPRSKKKYVLNFYELIK
jgi:RimJ/RimL family protein N-acetyltransferase